MQIAGSSSATRARSPSEKRGKQDSLPDKGGALKRRASVQLRLSRRGCVDKSSCVPSRAHFGVPAAIQTVKVIDSVLGKLSKNARSAAPLPSSSCAALAFDGIVSIRRSERSIGGTSMATPAEQAGSAANSKPTRGTKSKKVKANPRKKFFHCYLLQSQDPKHKRSTYIGFTVDPGRRIRQHK